MKYMLSNVGPITLQHMGDKMFSKFVIFIGIHFHQSRVEIADTHTLSKLFPSLSPI